MNIPLSSPDITAKERKAVMDVLRSPQLSLGPKLQEFEKAGARYVGRKYAAAVNSGTSGLHLIIKSLGIGRGDLVITSPFSFVASANCVLFEGARPVFVDIDEDTLNIAPEKIVETIKKHRTAGMKAILAVDVFGHPAEWDALYDIAQKYNLKLIEDSCEAIGAEYQSPENARTRRWKHSKKAGSFGEAGVFAFYPNKQITTGEGGLVVTDSKKIYDLCCSLRNQGRGNGSSWFNHIRLGYNYRLSDINCVLGIVQLQRIKKILQKRARIAELYNRRLQSLDSIRVPYSAPHVTMSWFVYVVRLTRHYIRKDRDRVLTKLRERGIASSNYFSPIHLQPFYRKTFGFRKGDFPVTEQVADRTIALPFFTALKTSEIVYITESLKEIMKENI